MKLSVGLPSAEQIRPGLWSIPVPLPSASLPHVVVYLFEGSDGAYLVDAGFSSPSCFEALESGMSTAGCAVSDVRGVLVTHLHPDHYGLAGRIREISGAWVAMHPAEAGLVMGRRDSPDRVRARIIAMLRSTGAPPAELMGYEDAELPTWWFNTPEQPDVLIEDGERPAVPGWDLTAIWTPGHSPGHLCFWEPRYRLLLTGDHVLPRITPSVDYGDTGADALGDFLASLDKLEGYDCAEVLPAHEHRFLGLQDRLQELRDHHEDRFAEVILALRVGELTAWDVAQQMRWSRPWHEVDVFQRRAAVAEADAHLRALEQRGVICGVSGEPTHWQLAAGR